MDYEWRIKLAERELAHLKELQAITRAHFDVTDQARETFGTTLERIEDNLEELSAGVRQLQAAQLVTEQKLQNLIEILAREHASGKSRGYPSTPTQRGRCGRRGIRARIANQALFI